MKNKSIKIKIKKFFSRNIISAILMALIPALTIILIEPVNFQKYKIELDQKLINHNRLDIYRDADKDENYELFRLYNFGDAPLALMIYDKFGNNIYQYNSKYYMPVECGYPSVYFADVNNDDSDDIIFFSQYKDSLFLNIFSFKNFKPLVNDRFITKIGINNKKDYFYKWICVEDINNDKYNELYFSIIGGFSLYPRKIFRYDYKNDSLISSINTGSKQRVFSFHDEEENLLFFSRSNAVKNCSKDFPYLYTDTCSRIFGYDKNLKFLFEPVSKVIFESSYSKKLDNLNIIKSIDIDEDSKPEFVFKDRADNSFYLYRNNLKNRVKMPLDENSRVLYSISSKVENEKVHIIFTSEKYIYYCTYYKNPAYSWKYLFWSAVFLFSFVFVRLIQIQQNKKNKKQNELKNRIISLQLKNTQNQLDPHFTFNALNVVASKIYKEDRNTAYDLFERFSRLMRSSLAFSDKIFRPLNDEIQFTEDYLEFQKSRFKDLFQFQINVSSNINTEKIEIPKMIVQGFAENCVKHAFKGINYKGKISITVTYPVRGLNPDRVNLIIEDNGIGIKQSHIDNPVPESGRGMIAMQEQVSLINKLYDKEIVIDITDKSKTGKQLTGTLVLIQI